MCTPRATLLVFTLGPRAETRRRSLLPEHLSRWEHRLRSRCLERTLEAGRAAGCETVVCSPHPLPGLRFRGQTEGDFGHRLRAAVAQAEEESPGPLVVVGTDTPDLGVRQIASSLALLEGRSDRVVLGPSPDGGFYLLAASRSVAPALAGIPWRRPETRRRLEVALAELGFEVVLLEPLRDLDRRKDLERWLAEADSDPAWRHLRRRLLRLLFPGGVARPPRSVFLPVPEPASPIAGRAPPPA